MREFDEALSGFEVVVDERFDGSELDRSRWLPYYLPQWSRRERSRARFRLVDGHLELFIDEEQPPWLPEIVPDLRVSSLQTGCFAGPVGSTVGQHRTDARMTVVEEQPFSRLITPRFAAVEMRARWTPHPDHMVALWMIGLETEPEESAEICICEIFGSEASRGRALVGVGVHPFGDPTITDDFEKVEASIDVSDFHDYAAIWTSAGVTFYIDGAPVRRVRQSPQYAMQLMLNIYDFGGSGDRSPAEAFVVERVRIHQLPEHR